MSDMKQELDDLKIIMLKSKENGEQKKSISRFDHVKGSDKLSMAFMC